MTQDKAALLRELDEIRDELWAILDDFDPQAEMYPGWTKREFFSHLGGWDGLIFETLRDYTDGKTPKRYPYKNADAANVEFVAMRKGLPLEIAKREAEINRFAIKVFLNAIPEDQYQQAIQFPWGMETLLVWLQGAIDHERDHMADIVKVKAEGHPLDKGG